MHGAGSGAELDGYLSRGVTSLVERCYPLVLLLGQVRGPTNPGSTSRPLDPSGTGSSTEVAKSLHLCF